MQIQRSALALFGLASAFLVALNVNGQTEKTALPQQAANTNSEPVHLETGIMIVEGKSKIGMIGEGGVNGQVDVGCKEAINPSNLTRQYFVCLTVQSQNFAASQTVDVDYSAIDSLIKGIEYLEKLDKSVTKLDSLTAEFHINDASWIGIWNGGSCAVGIGNAHLFFSKSDLEKFRLLIESAKQKLDDIKK